MEKEILVTSLLNEWLVEWLVNWLHVSRCNYPQKLAMMRQNLKSVNRKKVWMKVCTDMS